MKERTVKGVKRQCGPLPSNGGGAELSGLCVGTTIAVPGGRKPVESLRVGDLILTRDHGPQPVQRMERHDAAGPARAVRVAEGVLGNPAACILAPGTRVLMSGWPVELHFALEECLVPVSALCGAPGITAGAGTGGFFAPVLSQRGVIQAGGIEVESLADDRAAPAECRCLPIIDGTEARLLLPM